MKELINRVQERLDNNLPVEPEDIQALLNAYIELNIEINASWNN